MYRKQCLTSTVYREQLLFLKKRLLASEKERLAGRALSLEEAERQLKAKII